MVLLHSPLASNRGNRKGVTEAVGILEREAFTGAKSLPIVDKAVIIADSPKHSWIDQPGRAEPTAAEVNVGDAAARDANVEDLDRVRRNTIGKWGCWSLEYHYVVL